MKTLKYILLAIVALTGFAACSDDDTETTTGINGYGVYFPVDASSQILIDLNQNVVDVPVMRSTSAGEFSTRVLFTPDEESAGIFTVDPNVRFADGENTAYVEISFNFSDLEVGVEYPMTLSLADGTHSTAYGAAQYTFAILYDPWETLEGTAVWRDNVICGAMFGFSGYRTTEVTIQESLLTRGRYRLVNVYSPEFVAQILGASPAEVASLCRDANIVINATNPDKVWIERSEIGFLINPEYGWMGVASLCVENSFQNVDAAASVYGTLKNGVISFPEENSLLLNLPLYNGGGWYYTNDAGRTRIVLPGYSALDPIVEASLEGFFTDADGDTQAVFTAQMNEDAASFRWTVVEGDISADEETLAQLKAGIVDGSIESRTQSADGRFTYDLEGTGEFTAVLVPYSADGSVTGSPVAVPFEYITGGTSPSEFAATFTVTDIDETWATVSVTPNDENLLYYWDVIPTSDYQEILQDYQTIGDYFEDYFNYLVQVLYPSMGVSVTLPELVQSFSTKGASEPVEIDDLTPDTEYTLFAYCINKNTGAARSAISVDTFSTLPVGEMDPDYAAWLGTWTVTSARTEQTATPQSFDIEISLRKSNALLDITGWGKAPVNDNKLYTIWQKDEETQRALIGIPEQLTDEKQSTSYGIGTVAFLARCYGSSADYVGYMCWGAGDIALLGQLSGPSSAQLVGGSGQMGDAAAIEFTGADFFLMLDESDGILGWLSDFAVGPFSLVKKADAAAMQKSVRKDRTDKFSIPTRNAVPRLNLTFRMERAVYLKRTNLVERR